MHFRSRPVLASVGLFVLAASLGACSGRKDNSPLPSITAKEQATLDAKVNCATAPEDIKTLEGERASVAERMADGVRSIFPIAAVAGMLTGDYSERVEVASGEYNRDIETKIAEIKSICHLS
ncbi:MAG: hypothetical protein J0M12_08900 [Deltaproteobacteria bacterium]|nr:hypothetical protein [Deltaproteobacteria bacterium]